MSGSTEKFIKAILTGILKKGRWNMRLLNCETKRLVLVGFMVLMVFEGESVMADFTFGEPTNLNVNSTYEDGGPSISADGYLSSSTLSSAVGKVVGL